MTRHLTPGELIDALDTSSGPSQLHLDTCAVCRRTLDDLRALAVDVSGVHVPDPSPLFWDHFPARVRRATTAVVVAPDVSWWPRWRRTAFAGGVAATAAAVFALLLVLTAPQTSREPAVPTVTSDNAIDYRDPDSLASVEQLLAELSIEDVQEVAAMTPEALLVEELDADERTVFVRLVGERMEAVQ